MHNLRYALRQLGIRPGFSATVVLMLALGIGATTAIFSVFHQVLLQPLPVYEPGRLVNLGAPGPKPGSRSCGFAGGCDLVFSYPMLRDLQYRQDVFTGIAGHRGFEANLSHEGDTATGIGMLVSGSYFDVLGLAPALGRLIGTQDEPQIGESAVAVLSHAYWRERFGGDRNVIGSRINVNGQDLTIIGVAPTGFSGTSPGIRPQVFVPLTLRWLMEPTRPSDYEDRTAYWVYLFARLQPAVSIAQASAGINTLYRGILREVEAPLNSMPAAAMDRFLTKEITVEPGARGQSEIPANARQPFILLLGVTALVLAIVCVNVANLLLVRGLSRAGEMAIRASIGATRGRLLSQLLTEALLLALLGGVAGLPVAVVTLAFIEATVPAQLAAGLVIELSPIAVWFAFLVTLLTALLFAVVPALRTARTDPGRIVKDRASSSGAGKSTVRLRSLLVTVQVAFSMILLVLAGLFAESLMNLARVDLGLAEDSLLTFTVAPRRNGYEAEQVAGTVDRIEQALAGQPGVVGATSARIALISDRTWGASLNVEGFDAGPGADINAFLNAVSPSFFQTLSIPLLRGRLFSAADTLDSPQVAIVNESFVRKFDLGDDAIGRRIAPDGRPLETGREIVGVVADAKYNVVRGDIPAQYFLPRSQLNDLDAATFYVRTDADPDAIMRMIPGTVSAVDPDLPVSGLMTMTKQVQDSIFLDRLVALLSAIFAGLATLLAAVGLYGVLAYNVAQRTREMGLRLALGARPENLSALVFKQICVVAAIGGAIGLVGAVALGRAAESLLYGLTGYDPLVLIGSLITLSVVVFGASYLPARRAAGITPMEALRH